MLTPKAVDSAGHSCPRSVAFFTSARQIFPDGVNRSTIDVEPSPRYIASGKGAYVLDADGHHFLDLNNNFTTLIHGHGFEPVAEAVASLVRRGTCFANPSEYEITLGELLVSRIPAIEQIRFVNTGTEAVMFAIKAARAFTERPAIMRFAGAYHGAYDWAEIGQSGFGATNMNGGRVARPAYKGAPASSADDIVLVEFNDIDGLEREMGTHHARIAAILIDPMPSRAGLLAPEPDFIARLNELARRYGVLIIADEVLNLRQSFSGASHRYGLEADLVTLGKIIGGGFPIGAVGGRREVMAVFAANDGERRLPQGGTFSANPVSMLAGYIAMEHLQREDYAKLEQLGDGLRRRLGEIAVRHGATYSFAGAASLFRIHPKALLPTSYSQARMTADEAEQMRAMTQFFAEEGILLPFDAAASLSSAMGEVEIDHIAATFEKFVIRSIESGLEAAQ